MNQKFLKHNKTLVKDVSSEKGIVTLQISRFEKYDYDNDRMMKGAFTKTFKDGKQVHLVDHKVGTSTFVGLPIKMDSENLIIESQLNLQKTVAQELLSDYKFSLEHGRSLQHSQGFRAVKDKYKTNDKGGLDFYEVNMKEYSTVLFGAENDTPLHGIKSNSDALMQIELLENRCKFGFLSDESGKKLEEHIKQIKLILNEPQSTQSISKSEVVKDTSHLLFINHLNS